MKILVPTDFSKYAGYAFDSAIAMARKYKGEIHLFHAANISDYWQKIVFEKDLGENVNKSFEDYAYSNMLALKDKAKDVSITCYTHYGAGKFIEHIEPLVSQLKIDMVIMGSHGLSFKEDWMIGSNAQKCIRKLRTNVLILKKPLWNIDFKKVAFVSSLTDEDHHSFRRFLDFLRPMKGVKIHLLYVDTIGWNLEPSIICNEAFENFKQMALGFDCEAFLYKDFTVDAGVRHFTKEHNIEMIAISNHKRNPLKRFFQGSNVELLVNHSDLPVMSIDYPELKN